MKILIFLIIALIFSMFMAVDKDGVKINNKTIQTYTKRVAYCFIALIIFASIISWFTILPILGLLSLL